MKKSYLFLLASAVLALSACGNTTTDTTTGTNTDETTQTTEDNTSSSNDTTTSNPVTYRVMVNAATGVTAHVDKEYAEPVIEHFSQEIGQKRKAKTAVNDIESIKSESEQLKKKNAELEEENTRLHNRVEFLTDKVFEYADLMGRTVSDPLIYIVSPKTILNGDTLSGDPSSGIYANSHGYTIEIEMKSEDGMMPGIANYQKQMKTISGLKSYPVFEYCHLTIETDADLNLISMTTHERYQADMGFIKSKCTGTLTTHYSTSDVSIPSLNDQIDYSAYQA